MGRLIYFDDHHPGSASRQRTSQQRRTGNATGPASQRPGERRSTGQGDSLIPLQLGLDEYDIARCFSLLARYGRCPVYPRANPADAGKILFLVRIRDAIALNRYLLERLTDDNQALARRIDHIQMLENSEESLLSKAWDRIGLETSVQFSPRQGADPLDSIGQ